MANTPHLSHSLAKLIPYPATSRQAVPSYVFVYNFTAPASAADLGDLLIVLEVLASQRSGREACDLIAETIGNKYYNRDVTDDLEPRFESAIRSVNTLIRSFETAKGSLTEALSGIIAVVADNELLAARAGSANLVLWRHHKLHWIFEDSGHKPATRTSFRELAHGQLRDSDKLMLGTPAVFFELDASQINQVLSLDTAQAAMKQLHTAVGAEGQTHRHGAICAQFTDYNESMHRGLPAEPATVVVGDKPTVARKASSTIAPVSKKIAHNSSSVAQRSWQNLKTRAWPATKHHLQQAWQTLWIRYINRNPRLAAAIAGGVLLVIVLLIFVVARPHSNFNREINVYKAANLDYLTAQSQYADGNKTAALTSANAATAKLIILKNTDHKKLDAAIAKDPTITEKLSYEDLTAKLVSLTDKISGTVRVDGDVLYTTSQTQINSLALVSGKLYLLQSNNHLVEFDPTTKHATDLPTGIPASRVLAVTTDDATRTIYFLTNEPSVWQYSIPLHQANQVKLSSGEWDQATDIAFYNSNLYLMSPSAKQILKHMPTSIGFGPPVAYIKQNSLDLTTMRSLAINGNIFVGDTTGGISLFNLGAQKSFVATDLPAGLGWPAHLELSSKNDQLAALNNRGDRVYTMSLSDTGAQFSQQYAVSNAPHISSFTADDQFSNFYLAAGNHLLRVSAH